MYLYLGLALVSVVFIIYYIASSNKDNPGQKVLAFLSVCVLLGSGAFILLFIILFTGQTEFYLPYLIFVTLGILFFISNAIFRFLKSKVWKISFLVFLGLSIISVGVYEGFQIYERSITMDNHEVNLTEYQPFTDSDKIARLNDSASYRMEGDLLRLDGATALYPIYSAFTEATYPEGEYQPYDFGYGKVISTKTPNAYKNLLDGEVDIIFALGPSERQLADAKRKGVELTMTPIGKEAFVFFVNSKNPIEDVKLDEIKGIYSGKIRNWKEIGGNDEEIQAFQRPDDSGSQTALEQLMGDTPIMDAPTEDIVTGMGGIIEETSDYRNYKNSIGYSFRFFSMEMVENNAIRHLAIDGVYPDKDTIRTEEYPITYEFYAVTAGSDNPNIEPFLDWILSSEGQELVEKSGYVPVQDWE
ncbi:PstS family phosphate ABC transporter substrate-binding protein [Ornithinibacillus halophilus]|uniref:Phosphate transport system substrate-binding protein n=1 Tax=Ornithinibacillus halophilus TaxID=930117 RepID=A0A1M5I278_9BACI|nr:substrate-binding domain-containing protein [Ornithinibacillus halophilus]SHG22434.1 phosphate transport system substrate-binding protein [Ornithinibacillus halophilus]